MNEKRRVGRAANRPELITRDPEILFHDTGPTGWGRRRGLGDYKGTRSEHNFADQHDGSPYFRKRQAATRRCRVRHARTLELPTRL